MQRKTRSRQAAIGRLHPRKAEINQSDLSFISFTFIQQILQDTQSTVIIVTIINDCLTQILFWSNHTLN